MNDAQLLPFVQFEFAGSVGLDEGRYLEREPQRVLVVRVVGAPPPPRRRLRKPKPKEAEPLTEPAPVPLTTLTVVTPEGLGTAADAASWLARSQADDEAIEAWLDEALRTANLAIHAQRVASLDPYIPDVSAAQALAVRLGYGDGGELADGRWTEAVELPNERRRRRVEALMPQQRIAETLAGREQIDAATGAVLRARSDLIAGRNRDAALQLDVALRAMVHDRTAFGGSGQAADLAELEARAEAAAATAEQALAGELAPTTLEELEAALRICERVLRRRRAFG